MTGFSDYLKCENYVGQPSRGKRCFFCLFRKTSSIERWEEWYHRFTYSCLEAAAMAPSGDLSGLLLLLPCRGSFFVRQELCPMYPNLCRYAKMPHSQSPLGYFPRPSHVTSHGTEYPTLALARNDRLIGSEYVGL